MNTTLGTAYMVGKKSGAFSSQGTSLAPPPDLLVLEDSKHTSIRPSVRPSLIPVLSVSLVQKK